MLKLRHFDRALRYEFRMDELKARQEVGAGGTATASKHYPEEWGPSDNRKLTCSCGNPDPDHLTHNGEVRGASRLAGDASSGEAATSTDGLEGNGTGHHE